MKNNKWYSVLGQSLLISFVVLGGIYSLISDAQTIFPLIYSCFLFGLDIWIWSRYFIKSNTYDDAQSRNNENLKNILRPVSKNSIGLV